MDADGEAAIRKTSPFWKNHDQGAATVLVAALDPALNGKYILYSDDARANIMAESKGVLLHDCQMCDAMPYATDAKLAEKLWTLSEKLVHSSFKL